MTAILDFDFDIEYGSLGTEAEAREIFEAVGDRFRMMREARNEVLPPGWMLLGCGGARAAYLSPTGVVYKIAFDSTDPDPDGPTNNEKEHANFRRIRRSGRLPKGWRVPKSHLHVFYANYTRWDYSTRTQQALRGRVVVIACEYIEGKKLGGLAETRPDEQIAMESAFNAVGLHDTYGTNAIKTDEGTAYIIDAGEDMQLPEENQ